MAREHKTYPLLRYVPNYWGLQAPVIPPLLIIAAVLAAAFGLVGFLAALALTLSCRLAFAWEAAVLPIARAAFSTLFFLRSDRRLRL